MTLRRALFFTVLAGLLPMASLGQSPALTPDFFGHTNFFQLSNAQIRVTIAPGIGRIAQVRSDGLDVFRLDTALVARAASGEATGDFLNYGGDWLWPVLQARWSSFNDGKNWPPPPLFEKAVWNGTKIDNRSVELSTHLGAPLNIAIRRQITVLPVGRRVVVRQSIVREAESSVPVVLWNVSQVDGVDRVALPAESSPGYRVLAFAPPPAAALAECLLVDVFKTQAGDEHKLGSTSPRAWIAAEKHNTVLIERATGEPAGGNYGEDGCRVTMYSNRGLGYTEIETVSEEVALKPGQRLENMLTLELLPEGTARKDDCALADHVRTHVDGPLIAPQ